MFGLVDGRIVWGLEGPTVAAPFPETMEGWIATAAHWRYVAHLPDSQGHDGRKFALHAARYAIGQAKKMRTRN